jgi:hypothetical protein
VLGGVKMLCGVLVFGGVATANMPAAQTKTQVNPTVTHLEAFFAALGFGLHAMNLIEVRTSFSHAKLLEFASTFTSRR